ncbi:MAG TPA: hypothetical protein PK876_10980 [Elusimicrobiota bacterium]|nr:hypothetical protein [Elusimicrobiota bacterium]
MNATAHFLIPFDLGLELDFVGEDAKEIFKEVSTRPAHDLTFSGRIFPNARITSHLYKFGIGILQLTIDIEGDMAFMADLSCRAEALSVGKIDIRSWGHSLVDDLIHRAKKFATHQYEQRLKDIEVFPIFVFEKNAIGTAESFIHRHRKAFYGIVAGEPNYDTLSDFVLEQEKLENFGYYENELILVKRFGAAIASDEANTILKLVRLAFSSYWSLRSYNFLLDKETDEAQVLMSRLPPYYKFWMMPHRYQKFSDEAIAFVKDKMAIVDSLYNVSAHIPHIDSDWHLRTVYKAVEKQFDIDDLYKEVEVKLERIEGSYNTARDFLSTNFFIAVEIVLILSLAWMVMDTTLLYIIAHK